MGKVMDLFGWLGLDLFGNDYVLCNAGEWLCTPIWLKLLFWCASVKIWIAKGAVKKTKGRKTREKRFSSEMETKSALQLLSVAQLTFSFILLHQKSSPFKYKSQCDYDTWQYRACEPLANN